MDEVYISGALTAIADGAKARVFYELLAEIVTECGLRPYLPHHTTDPVAAPDLDPRSVYEIDRARVARSGLLIAYAGTPSFGVGIEAELAALLRVADVDGEPANAIRKAVADGKLFGAGLRDLVGRHALRGVDLAAFVLHDILERPFAELARTLGMDPRAMRRRVEQ